MRRLLMAALVGASLAWAAGTAGAVDWRPASSTGTAQDHPANPVVQLGKPVSNRISSSVPQVPAIAATTTSRAAEPVHQIPYTGTVTSASLGQPRVIRGQGPLTPEEQYNCGVVSEGPPAGGFMGMPDPTGFMSTGNLAAGFDNPLGGPITFQSDHCFDSFISPVSNPFFFEDPRSLTEVRPIFFYQRMPGKYRTITDLSSGTVNTFSGGNIFYYGLQGRLAFNERFSFVFSNLGGITTDPGSAGPFPMDGSTGMAELVFGPKYTFYRNECTNTLMAVGLNAEVGVGNPGIFQNTGTGALAPYITFGQKLGDFHVLGSFGYRFRLDKARSESFWTSLHVDYSILNRIYPLIELNWYYYTKNGNEVGADFEGQDLYNLGSNAVSGNSILNLAAGVRFKFTESVQAGVYYEFPLLQRDDLLSYRISVDMIFRY